MTGARFLHILYRYIAPPGIGLMLLVLMALPGDTDPEHLLIDLAVFLGVLVVGGYLISRHIDS